MDYNAVGVNERNHFVSISYGQKLLFHKSRHREIYLVSEIAYELGFEHSQSFNKLFKAKTNQTPLEFRASFN